MAKVSIIVVARNESRYIVNCLQSILQEIDQGGLDAEIIVVDGASTDQTKELVSAFLAAQSVKWLLLDNPNQTLAAGWNIGLNAASGQFVVRPDAHAALSVGYITKGIETLEKMPDVVGCGGHLLTRTSSFSRRHFAYALSSKVGVGNSPFRTSSQSHYADTAVFAVYRREALIDIGGLNEGLVRHQDNDLHYRLKSVGWRFYQVADMQAIYYCRDSFSALIKQMFLIGMYLPDLWFSEAGGGIRFRHLAPLCFVILMFFSLYLMLTGLVAYVFPLVFFSYLCVLTVEATYFALKGRDIVRLKTVGVIPAMHFSYGLGTLYGIAASLFKVKKEK